MTIEQELQLSYYSQVADIDPEHGVSMVQDIRSKQFYVKKQMTVYNGDIYRYLQAHPIANIPQIHLVIEADGVLTVIEDYIDGQTLAQRLESCGTLPQKEATGIAIQLCRILLALHSCTPAIVNRDIKPENIKITPDGLVKLVDFNTAKWSDPESTRDTVLLGTEGYAAPEQYGFGASGVQTDIYAVGVLLNVMCTGQLPNQSMAEGRLGKIVQKCVELSPSRRFQSVDQLLAALEGKANNLLDPRRFYPPGFRAKDLLQWILAGILYLLLLNACLGTGAKMAGDLNPVISQITLILTIFGIILFNGNYLNVHQTFVLTRSKHRIVRWLGMLLIDTGLLFLWVRFIDLFSAQ